MLPYLNRTGRKRKRSRKFKPGYDRTGGLYGRFRKRRKTNKTEQKFYDITLPQQTIPKLGQPLDITGGGPSPTTITLVDIAQGTSASQRIGRKITITQIHVRLIFTYTGTTIVGSLGASQLCNDTIRVMLYQDKQCNGQSAIATDLLQEDNLRGFRNINNTARFRILVDKTFDFNTQTTGAGGNTNQDSIIDYKNKKCYFSKLVKIPMEYSGVTGSITEMRSNNIGIITWSEHGTTEIHESRMRIRYTDK